MLATENLNQWFTSGDQAYIIVASAMVVTMVPGLGFLYSGLARRKSALSMIFACMGSFAIITFQWYFWGYSLAFSAQGKSGFIGDLTHFGLRNTLGYPSPGSPLIPELLYSFYQACISCTIEQNVPILTIVAAAILCCHRCHCRRSHCRARASIANDGLHVFLGYPRLLSYCMLGLEY